jgi:Peptidase family M28
MRNYKFKMSKIKYSIFIGSCVAVLAACGPDKPKDTITNNDKPVVTKAHVTPPDFNMDSAYAYVKAQADMGPRTPGSKAHDLAVAYYEKKFKAYGAEVIIQKGNVKSYDNKPWVLKNVIASFNPKAETRILLCSHWDSRPFADKDKDEKNRDKACLGVNDGASGVGVLIEMARLFSKNKPSVGIDIILFDLEDYGDNHGDPNSWCLGSQYWSKNLHVPYYGAKFGVLLDMVGAKNAIFPKEGLSRQYAGEYVNLIWGTGQKLGYGNHFINVECAEMTDDHSPVNKLAQIPCVDILHYDMQKNEFFEFHHTTKDDMNAIDKNTLKAVGQTLLEVIYNQ